MAVRLYYTQNLRFVKKKTKKKAVPHQRYSLIFKIL